MSFAAPINASKNLDLVTAVRLKFMEAYSDAYKNPAYTDYQKVVFDEDPSGDLIYSIYAEPLKPLRAWYGERPSSSVDYRYWTQAVRNFADSMEIDVDDIKDDANPAKRAMYMQTAATFADAAAALWPSLFAETIVKGITSTWLPDGQKIFDLHQFSPSLASLGTFRNYWANNVQGGSAAKTLNFANLLAGLTNGLTFKAPTGMDYPIRYSHLAVAPGLEMTARRLVSYQMLPGVEVNAGNPGGAAPNDVAQLFSPEVIVIGNLPPGMWALIDARAASERPIAIKKRQDITWQYVGPAGATVGGMPSGDEGAVSEMVFNTNKLKYGPKARGEGFFRNWWRIALFDGNASPVTTLSIVS